jgi:hypothetical protein
VKCTIWSSASRASHFDCEDFSWVIKAFVIQERYRTAKEKSLNADEEVSNVLREIR